MIVFESSDYNITLNSILKSCEIILGVNNELLFQDTRERDVVIKRQIFYYSAKKHTKKSFRQIREFTTLFGMNQNHATLIHAIKNINNLLSYDKIIQKQIKYIENQILVSCGYKTSVADVDLLQTCIKNTKNYNINEQKTPIYAENNQ